MWFKKLVKNYRPISKQNCVPKILDKIVASKIYTLVENSLSQSQHGFIKGRSITTNLASYTNYIASALEEGSVVHSIYTDFSKAFDKVIIKFLISKLKALGFHSSLLNWLSSFLSDRFQFVKIGQIKSFLFRVLSGLPQGSHLGPLLFILMINDLPSIFAFASSLLYADDLKLFSKISSMDDCRNLQKDLSLLLDWCSKNGFKLNFDKCLHMVFVKAHKKFDFVYKLKEHELKSVSEILDLGVYLVTDFTFNRHFNYICAKAASMLGFLKRNCKHFNSLDTLKIIYFSYVRSQLEFASVVWSPYFIGHIKRIEAIQKSFTRYALIKIGFCSFENRPDYLTRCRLLGIQTLAVRRHISEILFIHHILSKKINSSYLLDLVRPREPISYNLRNRHNIHESTHRTLYGQYEPITRCIREYNSVQGFINFNESRQNVKLNLFMHFNNIV